MSQQTSVQRSIIPLVPEDKFLHCAARKGRGRLESSLLVVKHLFFSGMGAAGTGEEKLLVGIP